MPKEVIRLIKSATLFHQAGDLECNPIHKLHILTDDGNSFDIKVLVTLDKKDNLISLKFKGFFYDEEPQWHIAELEAVGKFLSSYSLKMIRIIKDYRKISKNFFALPDGDILYDNK